MIKCFHPGTAMCRVWELRLEHCCPRKQQSVIGREWALESSFKLGFATYCRTKGKSKSWACEMRLMATALHRVHVGIRWHTQMKHLDIAYRASDEHMLPSHVRFSSPSPLRSFFSDHFSSDVTSDSPSLQQAPLYSSTCQWSICDGLFVSLQLWGLLGASLLQPSV